MKPLVEHAEDLKQALLDFVLESEGNLAIALEAYSAEEMVRLSSQYISMNN
jgi:hypothetical protein